MTYSIDKNILYYIEHVPTEAPVYYDSSRHTVGCVNCDGYLRQTHTSEITALSTIQHGYTCCTGGESNHTGIYTYSKYSNDYHWVSYACCFGRVKQEHTYTAGVNSYCTRCGQVKQGPAITPITPFKKTPAEVTLTE